MKFLEELKSKFSSDENGVEDTSQQKQGEQQSQKPSGLVVAAESHLKYVNEENLSEEEKLERSWEFLTFITDKVDSLPPATRDKIMEIGRMLAKSGTSYIHMKEDPHRRRVRATEPGDVGKAYPSH